MVNRVRAEQSRRRPPVEVRIAKAQRRTGIRPDWLGGAGS